MPDFPRLIEFAFPLKQTSLDSVHEKNVRHGHISTLHIWPARRPLAACRAALIATLLPDPSAQQRPDNTPDKEWEDQLRRQRRDLCEKIGGTVEKEIEKKKKPDGSTVEREKEVTKGGILHWGREAENADTLEWFRQQIRKAYGGRAPKVFDPFAGGGAIPLEALRLGCEATAADINPVAWFLLKCTLEYPQKLAGQTRPLPPFVLKDAHFMDSFFKAKGLKGARLRLALERLGHIDKSPTLTGLDLQGTTLDADLAWQVRAWGRWILDRARRDLARFYPTYAELEPVKKNLRPFEPQPLRLVPLKEDGTPEVDSLNTEFSDEYLARETNPRWVAKTTVAYLWARTVICKNCRATVPLLKTRWLCKKDNKRVLLTMEPKLEGKGVHFGVLEHVPAVGGNAAQKAANDKKIAAGTMTRSGATCPCCSTIMTMEDIRLEGQAGRLAATMTAAIVDGPRGKEYRPPTEAEAVSLSEATCQLDSLFADVPLGKPAESTPKGGGKGAGRAFSVQGYGLMRWCDLFTARQLAALATFVRHTQAAREHLRSHDYPPIWLEAISAYLAIPVDKVAAFNCTITRWFPHREGMCPIFSGYRIEMIWDHGEINPLSQSTGAYGEVLTWLEKVITFVCQAASSGISTVIQRSVLHAASSGEYDVRISPPPTASTK
jgi:adenine-specific DNA methylase